MIQSGGSALTVIAVVLALLGSACLIFAPALQKAGLRMMGEPRNRLAAWSGRVAASRTGLLGIRGTGALCVTAAAALLLALSK